MVCGKLEFVAGCEDYSDDGCEGAEAGRDQPGGGGDDAGVYEMIKRISQNF